MAAKGGRIDFMFLGPPLPAAGSATDQSDCIITARYGPVGKPIRRIHMGSCRGLTDFRERVVWKKSGFINANNMVHANNFIGRACLLPSIRKIEGASLVGLGYRWLPKQPPFGREIIENRSFTIHFRKLSEVEKCIALCLQLVTL